MNWKEFHNRHEDAIDNVLFAFGIFGALAFAFAVTIISYAIAVRIIGG